MICIDNIAIICTINGRVRCLLKKGREINGQEDIAFLTLHLDISDDTRHDIFEKGLEHS